MRRVYQNVLLLGAAASTVAAAGIAIQWVEVGSADGRWTYRYIQTFSIHAFVVGLIAAAVSAAALRLPTPDDARREWSAVFFWIALAIAVQAFIRTLTPFSLESMFVSDGANSFYTVTEQHSALRAISDFASVQRSAPLHAQSNMPGKVMLVYALRLISARPDILPWLVIIVSNLGAVFMYGFVRDLFNDRRVALYATVLYLFVPAKLVFFPLMNTVTPVLVLACLFVLMRWLRGNGALAALLGFALYALVFFEPLPLVAGLLFAGLVLRAVMIGQLTWQQLVLQTSVALLTFVATAEAVQWIFGFNTVGTFRRIGAHAVEFNAIEGRPYAVWIRANLWEFALGAGFCQAALCGAVLGGAFLSDSRPLKQRLLEPASVLALCLTAVLLATDLLGVNRGEVVRLWIFLACLFQIPAAYVCAQAAGPGPVTVVVATSLVHAAIGTSTIGFIVP